MKTYTLYNPTRNMIPVVLRKDDGDYNQVNLQPRSSIIITESQISDVVKNLTSEPRNILRLKLNTKG